jgi:hypothetical protein
MFLRMNLTKAFMTGDYAAHRATIIWRQQESFIPQYQERVPYIRQGEKLNAEVIQPLHERMRGLREQIQHMEAEYEDLLGEYGRLHAQHHTLMDGRPIDAASTTAAKEKQAFTRKCTATDCKGWLTSAWRCGLCENYTCPDCFVVIGAARKGALGCTHICAPADLETAALIRSSTRPCPKCGQAIEKKDGCNMMFCTSCHTPFDWVTGKAVTGGRIHNPHYYEWLGRNGGLEREPGDVICGGLPHARYLLFIGTANMFRLRVTNLHHLAEHIQEVELPRYTVAATDGDAITRDLMTRYLMDRVPQKEVERALALQEVKRTRKREFYDIFNTFATIAAEYMREIREIVVADATTTTIVNTGTAKAAQVEAVLARYLQLVEFINGSFRTAGEGLGVATPQIAMETERTYEWNIIRERITRMS